MERTVLLAAATWVGGVGAWAVGCGYALRRKADTVTHPAAAGGAPSRRR